MEQSKKNIAILSTMYYPVMGAPSACIDKYVQELNNEYNFHIITRNDELKKPEVSDRYFYFFSNRMHEFRKKLKYNVSTNKNKFLSKIGLLLINGFKFIQTQFKFPSAQFWEVNGYYDTLEKVNERYPLTAVISVSNIVVTQLAALKFKKKHSNVKWIPFVLDPYAEFYIYYKYKLFKSFWRKRNFAKEQEIYSLMDAGMFSPEMYKYVPKKFDVPIEKINKIEFALDNRQVKIGKKEKTDFTQLIYAGLFYKTIRNPEFMLQTLSQVTGIELNMFVAPGECEDIIAKYSSNQNFHRQHFLNRPDYITWLYEKSDILINIGNNASLQAPSKMLELLSTGKPIINFYHSKDSQFEMIEKYPLGINVGREDINAVEKVSKFCKEMKGKSISFEEVWELFPENRLENQVNLLRKLIEK